MAYSDPDDLDANIETDEGEREAAVNVADGLIDGYVGALYEAPVDFDDLDAGDEKTRLQARFRRWSLAIAAHVLTANRPGQSEQIVKNYDAAIQDLREVRAGLQRLPLLTAIEAPVRARAW
jgi:phage gp36-like protein